MASNGIKESFARAYAWAESCKRENIVLSVLGFYGVLIGYALLPSGSKSEDSSADSSTTTSTTAASMSKYLVNNFSTANPLSSEKIQL